jgi:predicted thioesterase
LGAATALISQVLEGLVGAVAALAVVAVELPLVELATPYLVAVAAVACRHLLQELQLFMQAAALVQILLVVLLQQVELAAVGMATVRGRPILAVEAAALF